MLGSLIVVWLFICLLFLVFRIQRPKNFPPGPRPVPIFGNLFQLNGDNPLKDYERLAERYGNIYSLYMGGTPAVVLNGLKAVKEALVTKAADFSGRPQNLLMSHLTQGNGVVFLDYGPAWKEHRRFALMTLRNFGMGKQSMEDRILGETEHLVAYFEKCTGCIKYHLPGFIWHSLNYDDKTLQEYLSHYDVVAEISNGPWGLVYDMIPMVRSLPLPFRKAFTHFEAIKSMIATMVQKQKTLRVPGEPENFVDCYLDELEKGANGGSYFNDADLVRTIMDLHGGGTETSSNTLLTAFLYLMTKPDIQERCQQEIDVVLEGKAYASFEDRHKMPYTQAMIHETQRITSAFPLSVPHSTSKDTELMSYSIPKGTVIIPNLWSVLYEEDQWKFPHEFNLANFLNEQGEFEKPEAFLPFSAGPRICLGEGLARMELFFILVTLLRRFQFYWPEDAGEPDFAPVFGISLKPKPYRMGIRLRQAA